MFAEEADDVRGWIMCVVSGIACVIGASIICVDILVRWFPSKRNFRIEDSGTFLACSLSLSFGVMIFSALVSMLPSSKKYLLSAEFSPTVAEWTRLGCFIGGFLGIQIISRFLHRFIPSHVVDCDHTHDATPAEGRSHTHSRSHSHGAHDQPSRRESRSIKSREDLNGRFTESSPLLVHKNGDINGKRAYRSSRNASIRTEPALGPRRPSNNVLRRPSMMEVQNRVMSFVKDTKDNCDADGPCYGYSDPCGRECFNRIGSHSIYGSRKSFPRGLSASRVPTGVLEVTEEQAIPDERASTVAIISSHASHAESYDHEHSEEACGSEGDAASDASEEDSDIEAQHHHHVPTNAFLSIGLQTSIAIALHKLPEGFITYATNHASPSLGFTVFMALFIHNITEGFAMALPLYLALGSRLKAMLWSSLLGGFSQPLGAGIAAIWFKVATHTSGTPGAAVYGCMFAVTAGIMTSVALALFVEGLSVNHNAPLCVGSALVGMGILGVSTALTAEGGGHH